MTESTIGTDHTDLFIGGTWTPSRGGETRTVVDPSTERPLGTVVLASTDDVDAAVAAARAAFDDPAGWSSWTGEARADALDRFADALTARSDQIAAAVTSQNGMPIGLATALEGAFAPLLLRYYADLARSSHPQIVDGMLGGRVEIRHVPYGVVGAIAPWNYPQTLAAMKYAPALAAGCTVVLKAPVESPLDARLVADAAIEAGLPAGVLNILPGDVDAGRALVAHPRVAKVAFTGSTAAGRDVARVCGDLLRPVTLELGGKSAGIVLDDADLASSVEDLFGAVFINNGQTCFRTARILAPQRRYDEVVALLADLSSGAAVGDPRDAATAIGPLVHARARARDRVMGYIDQGRATSRLVTGGGTPDGPGFFVQPTVFADVDNDSPIGQEEIFGPVVTVAPYRDEDDAVAIANDSVYGLGGTVWSRDAEHAARVARRLQTGTVGINGYTPDPAGPFGGFKNSGIGREFATSGFENYRQPQTIYLG
ncbi:aldehyde dehydrogenase family protein [Gordonia shandongensis]|uniref:aldehyde dehydrogenase family protein n=1 Tax=Gordonia shandongensis TaxID=376351 RepID=UPI0003F7437A|nr:aldehyde dehydrogenase family protein [Gordonia shandongensis]